MSSYEQALLKQPKNKQLWLEYADSIGDQKEKAQVLFRAVHSLPDQELWTEYVRIRVQHLRTDVSGHEKQRVERLLNESLLLFPTTPTLWQLYMEGFPSRPVFDAALEAVDNKLVWPLYLLYARSNAKSEDTSDIFLRFLQFAPSEQKTVFTDLLDLGYVTSSIKILTNLGDEASFEDWKQVMTALIEHEVPDSQNVYQKALALYPSEDAWIVIQYSMYCAIFSEIEAAQDVLDRGVSQASTLKAFNSIIGAYHEFLTTVAEEFEIRDPEKSQRYKQQEQILSDREPMLLSDVVLRTEPNRVEPWLERAKLWYGTEAQAAVYRDAINTLEPRHTAQLNRIWIAYAELYTKDASKKDLVRAIFENAVKVCYRDVRELESVWLKWSRIEAKDSKHRAQLVLQEAVAGPQTSTVDYRNTSLSPQERAHKSPILWSELLGLLLSQLPDTLEEAKTVFDRMLQLKVVGAENAVLFAGHLKSLGYVDDAFRLYDRAVDVVGAKDSFKVWDLYITAAESEGWPILRLRGLFQRAKASSSDKLSLVLRHIKAELVHGNHGDIQNAFEHAWSNAETNENKSLLLRIYINWAKRELNTSFVRGLYDRGLKELDDNAVTSLAIDYAEDELRMGNNSRAHGIYDYTASFNDPETEKGALFWKVWEASAKEYGGDRVLEYVEARKAQVLQSVDQDLYMLTAREREIKFV